MDIYKSSAKDHYTVIMRPCWGNFKSTFNINYYNHGD